MASNFKYIPYRNSKILEFAKGQPCQHCGKKDGSTVAAHSNLIAHGKGVGKKSDDCFVAYLCAEHHEQYDRKSQQIYYDYNGKQKGRIIFTQDDFNQAMHKTWKLLLDNGVLK